MSLGLFTHPPTRSKQSPECLVVPSLEHAAASLLFPRFNRSLISLQGWLTVGFVGTIAFKLSLAYLCLIPALCLFWLNAYKRLVTVRTSWIRFHTPLLFFITYSALAALLGLNPAKSLHSLVSLTLLSTSCFLIAWYVERHGVLGLLCVFLGAQGIAALNTAIASGSAGIVPRIFLGEVTQAGQFGISLVIGLSWLARETRTESWRIINSQLRWGIALFSLSLLLGFFASASALPLFVAMLVLPFLIRCRAIFRMQSPEAIALSLCTLAIPLIAAGLIIDLKRGPWIGAWAGIVLLIAAKRKRLIGAFLGCSALAAVVLQPVAHRLEATIDHFFIAGGRSVIWQIGGQLIQQFPLGIGLKNSSVLRSFSHQIPPELTHFHSNLINLVVETGIIGAALYLWWIVSLCATSVKQGKSSWLAVLPPLITWQVAGLVEYNIGDKEVILVVYVAIGLAYWLLARDFPEEMAPSGEVKGSTCDSGVESA